MRLAFLLATLGLLIAPVRPAVAQRAGSPPTRRREPAPKPPAPSAQTPGQAEKVPAPQPKGEAPSVPTGMTPAEAAAPVPDTGVITKINVQGNRRVEADAIRAALPLKPGDTFDRRKLKDALLAVWKTGYFNDIKLDVSAVPPPGTGYQLTVLVSEKPAVREIKLEGNAELSRDDLKETIEVKQFQILDPEGVRKSAKKMQEKYVEKGYFLAEVSWRLDPLPNNEVNVVFVINEHAKVTVKEIRFVGTHAISTAELKGAMITQEGSFWSFLSSAGTYREDAFARDEYVLQGLYYDRGYLYVKFGKAAIELSPDRRFIFITIPIEEGDPYDIGKIDLSGDLLEPKEKLLALVETRPGKRFSKTILQRDLQVLADVYKDKGYAYANVTPDTDVHAENKTVDINFAFQKGNLVNIEKIEVVGNNKTRDKVIRREMRIRAGDKMVLEVTVKEKLTGTFQLGFGFTGGESFFGQAQLSQNNLLGYGHTASLSVEIASLRQLFPLSYLDPYFLDTAWTASIDLYRSELLFTGFDRQAIGAALTAGYEIFEDFRFFGTYTLEGVDVIPTGGTALQLRNQFSAGRTSSLRFSFNYDKRDNRLFPTNGHLESASAEFATSLIASQNLFQRYRLIERRYRPLFWGLVAKVNLSIGYIRSTDPLSRPISISEKFFAGGINSIRGYTLRSTAPTKKILASKDPDAGVLDYAVGGNKELLTNWEIEFPIVESAGIRGVLFYDMGNVFAENENFFQSNQRPDANGKGTLPLGLFHSTGFGVRWFSPLGPLRFEVGFPLTRRPIDDPYLFEFTIGNFF